MACDATRNHVERAVIRVFVSFDQGTDRDLYGNLVEQAGRGDAIAFESQRNAVHDRGEE